MVFMNKVIKIIGILLLIFFNTNFAQDNFDIEKANGTIHKIH